MRISVGRSRKDTKWKDQDLSWDDLCKRLASTKYTTETVSEYKAMSRDDKAVAKDVGGFVGGVIKGGKRVKGNVECRTLITLDSDFAGQDSWEIATMMLDCAMCCYSTHSHTPKSPRLRFVIPLSREVTPDEYEPIARQVAYDIGIEQFDVTTYETNRLMYWPSTPVDGKFVFERQMGDPLDADAYLNRYTDWHDASEWPTASSESTIRDKLAKNQGKPEEKSGIVGVFCRTYDIHSVIEKYLSDEYIPCNIKDRYTYTKGTTTAGAVVYEQGSFLYSHHSTDPASMQLCNAFDLVRIHKYGDLDSQVEPNTPVTRLPSYLAMVKLASEDDEVKKTMLAESFEKAKEAFSSTDPDDDVAWATKLQVNKNGAIEATTDNLVRILENDNNIKGAIAINEFKGLPCIVKDVPWRKCTDSRNGVQWEDEDMSALTHYVETTYGIYNSGKLNVAFGVVSTRNSFHPIRDYLNSLSWDGTCRGESLFIDCMGAEDNLYTREVTRKWLTAAVARVMRPGCKFDNLIVLVGAQGMGKSYLGHKLGRGWFSDTFGTVQGKDAYDQLKGCWIIEIAELSAMKKAEVESVKMFISKQEDNYRGAYREFSKANKRQCVFYGTTNDDSFLRDQTGNRRFWPIEANNKRITKNVFDLTDDDIDQVWAEAVHWYESGEKLNLSREVTELAAEEQQKFMSIDPRQGQIEEYLDRPIPANWDDLDRSQRRNYIQGYLTCEGPYKVRDSISVVEVAYELFGEEIVTSYSAKEYHSMLTGIAGWKKTGRRKRIKEYGQQYVYEREDL